MNELKPEDVMKALEICAKPSAISKIARCKRCPYWERDCSKEFIPDVFALLREKDAEVEMLKEVIDTSSEVVDYAVYKIREARASMLDEARRLSFAVGDQQYISIAELEKIAKGNAE